MVQHNNVQPPSSSSTPGVIGHSTGGSSKGSRLLPYPPIVGEAELFHPRPRKGVGVNGLAGELESRLEDGDVEGDETIYHSALDIQTGIDDSENGGGGEGSTSTATSDEETLGSGNAGETRIGSDATDGDEHPEKAKENDDDEPSVQDLLFPRKSLTRPRVISGVEAWERELGETVNRINSSGISTAATATGGGSISSIGGTKTRLRPRKREVIGEIGKMSELDGLSKKLNAVDDNGSATLASTSSAPSTSRQSALDERESKIAILESSLNVRESSIAERDSLLTERESSIIDRESSIADRESSLDIRESCLVSRELTTSKLESDLTDLESALTSYDSEIQRRMGDMEQLEMEVEKRASEVEKREQELFECETRVEKRVSEVVKREQEITERESGVEMRGFEMEKWERDVSERETGVEKRESGVDKREQEVSQCEMGVEKREAEVENREQEVSERETRLEKRGFEAEKREQDVSERETRVESREVEVKEWYQRKLSEIDERVLAVDDPTTTTTTTTLASAASSSGLEASCTTKSKWPLSPTEFARRFCATFLRPVLGEDWTPEILLPGNGASDSSTSSSTTSSTSTSSSSTTTTSSPTHLGVPFWSHKRDFFVNRLLTTAGGGSFLVLVGIGICVVFLRGVVGRVLRAGPGGFGRR